MTLTRQRDSVWHPSQESDTWTPPAHPINLRLRRRHGAAEVWAPYRVWIGDDEGRLAQAGSAQVGQHRGRRQHPPTLDLHRYLAWWCRHRTPHVSVRP